MFSKILGVYFVNMCEQMQKCVLFTVYNQPMYDSHINLNRWLNAWINSSCEQKIQTNCNYIPLHRTNDGCSIKVVTLHVNGHMNRNNNKKTEQIPYV